LHDVSLPATVQENQYHESTQEDPLLAALVLALLGLLFAGYWYLHGRYFESTDNAYLQSEVTGIGSKLSGYISEVLVTDNQAVKAGQLIARLDDREYRTKVAEAEADLHLNQATADNLAATRIQQLSLIRQAEAKVSSANAEQVRAQQQVRRVSQLNERHYSSQDSLDEVRAGRSTRPRHWRPKPPCRPPASGCWCWMPKPSRTRPGWH
jgi:membrane fusion protein (multidrug efflux system)